MEKTKEFNNLKAIGKIYEKADGCELRPDFFIEVNDELKQLSTNLSITEIQAFFVAMVFTLNHDSFNVEFSDIVKHCSCNPTNLLEYNNELEDLFLKGIIIKEEEIHDRSSIINKLYLFVNEKIEKAIIENKPIPNLNKSEYEIITQGNQSIILKSINKVFEVSENCKLKHDVFETIDSELKILADYFNTSIIQAFFISIFFAKNNESGTTNLDDIARHIYCSAVKLLFYQADFEVLLQKNILVKEKVRSSRYTSSDEDILVNSIVVEAVIKNEPFPVLEKFGFKNITEFLEEISELKEQRSDEAISTHQLFHVTHKMLYENLQFPVLKNISILKLNKTDQFILLDLIWGTMAGNETVDISRELEDIFERKSQKVNYLQDLLNEKNVLLKKDLVEIEEAQFFNNTSLKLSDKSIAMLEKNGIKIFQAKKKNSNLLAPEDIKTRKLIFNAEEMKHLHLLNKLMKKSELVKVQKSLESKKLPIGVTVLLHGAPGTGKTESVLQIAKKTNREIMKVDISQTKSMWFGESEKLVKRIFTNYKTFAKECKNTPILLFNEADAIISKRKSMGSSNVAQTENAIQNILLEEIENFEGILIATTNLISNLDNAFDRRFLFKIEFQNPDFITKSKIWKLKMPKLKLADCKVLASKFNFSGGQIDNIARKVEIQEVIHGAIIDLRSIIDFCESETFNDSGFTRIGFK